MAFYAILTPPATIECMLLDWMLNGLNRDKNEMTDTSINQGNFIVSK